ACKLTHRESEHRRIRASEQTHLARESAKPLTRAAGTDPHFSGRFLRAAALRFGGDPGAFTCFTSALLRVEREEARIELAASEATDGTAPTRREDLPVRSSIDRNRATSPAECLAQARQVQLRETQLGT